MNRPSPRLCRTLLLHSTAIAGLLLLMPVHQAAAQTNLPIRLNLDVGGETAQLQPSTFGDVFRSLSPSQLASRFPGYNGTSALAADATFRGSHLLLSSPAGSTAMRLQIPGFGVDRTAAAGPTREANLATLGAGLSVPTLLTQLQSRAVAETTTDPVAGNPSSLLAHMTASDFAATAPLLGATPPPAAGFHGRMGLEGGWTGGTAGGASTIGVPFGSEFGLGALGAGGRVSGFVNGGFGQTYVDGTTQTQGQLGGGVRLRLVETARWGASAVVGARYGIAGSEEYATVGALGGGFGGVEGHWRATPRLQLGAAASLSGYKTSGMVQQLWPHAPRYDLAEVGLRFGVGGRYDLGETHGLPLTLAASAVQTTFSGSKQAVSEWREYTAAVELGHPYRGVVSLGGTVIDGGRGVSGGLLRVSAGF